MDTSKDLDEHTMADAWAYIQGQADAGVPLRPNAYRLAFADPEFLLRRETRGVRLQLELLKPDLDQIEMGIEHTIVVFGSARFSTLEDAQRKVEEAGTSGDTNAMLIFTSRPGISAASWLPTARRCQKTNACTSAPAAAPASWRQPTAVPPKPEHPRWA